MPSRPRWFLYAFLGLVLVPFLGFAAWTWITLHYSYSTGQRAGFLQKISRKGWVCKTWEGEIVMTSQPGVPPQIFQFSVRDEAIAQQLVSFTGRPVSLTYDQHKGVPTSCFGETEYFITRVQPQN
jgi:hypothetical protein